MIIPSFYPNHVFHAEAFTKAFIKWNFKKGFDKKYIQEGINSQAS